MNKNMIFVLAGGFVIAVLVSVMMISIIQPGQTEQPKVVEQVKTAKVLVLTKALRPGDELSPDNSSWKEWPEKAVFDGVITKASTQDGQVKGRINRAMGVGEPVLRNSLIKDGPNLLAASLDKGMRAVALNVNAASTAGGFITPGDMVDVIVTFAIRGDRDEEELTRQVVQRYISETVLENVQVMAIDQQSAKPDNGSKVGRTVTLAVSNKGARELMLASQMGELSLALRALGDEEISQKNEEIVTDVTTAKIFGEIQRLRENSPVSPNRSVRILSGSGVQSIPAGPPVSSSNPSDDRQIAQRYN